MRTSKLAILGAATLMCASFIGCSEEPSTSGTGAAGASTGIGAGPGSGGEATSSGTAGSGGATGGAGGTGGDPFVFDDTPFEDYVQTDRHGAVEAGTVGIAAGSGLGLNMRDISIRDDYNASNPVEDALGNWIPEIQASLTLLHGALDDDLTGLGLTPSTVAESLTQAGPVIVPDTIKFNPANPVGYPNGRALTDQVVDLTVAAALLDLGVHQLTTLADIPVNPDANDVPFKAEFPYLADPH